MTVHDVIVVGGGPAGSSAARRCAQLGLDTLLIDRAVFPRDKLCGGALTDKGLNWLGFDLPPGLCEREIYGARVHFGGQSIEALKPYRVVTLVDRNPFDHYLLGKAEESGAQILQGVKITALEVGSDVVTVSADSRASFMGRVVIGCDGVHSLVGRSLGSKNLPDELGYCVQAKYPLEGTPLPDRDLRGVDIHFDIAHGGYGWIFPHRKVDIIGVGGLAGRLHAPRAVMRGYLELSGYPPNLELRGFPIPIGGGTRRLVSERVLLAGDAAGFVDAFTGEGIAYAIRSGQLAAEVCARAIHSADCTQVSLAEYTTLCLNEFWKDLRFSRVFARLMHRFPRVLLRLMANEPQVAGNYIDVVAQRKTYQEFVLWLLPHLPQYLLRKSR